ncbi:3-oxoacyl-[acyl-carrier-protein] synthase 2 [Rickettsiales bacterium Ac37b]|nr:3-oxoacyl-[acyl-carrier-protein] synthase 2 [Rickettsiales bacterium Ac37b]
MRRVVVTGIGLVTPLGYGVPVVWQRLLQGESGIREIDRFDASSLSCRVAGQVPTKDERGGIDTELVVSAKDQRRIDRFVLYGICAATQAIEDSGLVQADSGEHENIGVMIGSGIGGLPFIEENSIMVHEKGARKLSPFFIPASLINLVSGHVSIKYGLMGPNHSVVTACSTGAHAIGDAAQLIALGEADAMVAGGTEGAICMIGVAGFAAARALSTNFNDNPTKASRPWDKDRDGFVMGEGSGVLVLEEYEHAKKRGAKIYGEVVGYGLSGDAYHITAPHPEGRGAYKAMKRAIEKSGLSLSDIGYVNAHGTSTPIGDEIELATVERIFGEEANKLSMSSTKSCIGHLLGAAGSVEAIFSLLAMSDNTMPPTINLENPPENCKIDLVPNIAKEKKLKAVMSNSFGFGGTNASLVFKKL